MERASDLEERGEFHGFRSEGADLAEKGQDDMVDKRRMKQPKSRPPDDKSPEKPAGQTVTESQPPAKCRPLN